MGKSLRIQVVERLKAILKEKGWKPIRLAEESGYNKGYVSAVLSGKKNLTLETLERLQKALKCSIIRISEEKPKT